MTNQEKLVKAFSEGLGIEPGMVKDELTYNTIPQWDSTAHMMLIGALEREFDVMLDTDEIIDMSSVAKAKSILTQHQISF